MDLSMNYTTDSNEIKSENSEGQIGLALGYGGQPFDLHTITDHTITIKIGNAEGYIQDITIDTSNEDDDQKYSGNFFIALSDPHIQNLPPDVYYLEAWINVQDQNGNTQQLIFPSSGVLPFTINSNMVNGSNSMPMITFDAIQRDWDNFKQLVQKNEAETEVIIDNINQEASGATGQLHSEIADYQSSANNDISEINSVNNEISNASNDIENNINTISGSASSAYNGIQSSAYYANDTINTKVSSAYNALNYYISKPQSAMINTITNTATNTNIITFNQLNNNENILNKRFENAKAAAITTFNQNAESNAVLNKRFDNTNSNVSSLNDYINTLNGSRTDSLAKQALLQSEAIDQLKSSCSSEILLYQTGFNQLAGSLNTLTNKLFNR